MSNFSLRLLIPHAVSWNYIQIFSFNSPKLHETHFSHINIVMIRYVSAKCMELYSNISIMMSNINDQQYVYSKSTTNQNVYYIVM